MFRAFVVIVALLPVAGAQTPSADPAPMNVVGHIVWSAIGGPELSMTMQNTSARGIQGYFYEAIFTDPGTGKLVSKSGPIGCYRSLGSGVLIASGAETPADTPVVKPLPITASGTPAKYSFNVDLVFFEDGTTWGPAKTAGAQQLLAQIAALRQIKEAQSKLRQ
jgi:hypothetical protein